MPWRCKKCGKIKLPSNLLPSGLCYACNAAEDISTKDNGTNPYASNHAALEMRFPQSSEEMQNKPLQRYHSLSSAEKMEIVQAYKIVQDCGEIVCETKDFNVFAERYSLLLDNLEKIAALEPRIEFAPSLSVSERLKLLRSNEPEQLKSMVFRGYAAAYSKAMKLKTDKGKLNAISRFIDGIPVSDSTKPVISLLKKHLENHGLAPLPDNTAEPLDLQNICNFAVVYYKDGHIQDFIPRYSNDIYDPLNREIYYGALHIVVDGVPVDLSDPESIAQMPIPNFQPGELTTELAYQLKLSAIRVTNPAISCVLIPKVAELMRASDTLYAKKDYRRLVQQLWEVGLLEEGDALLEKYNCDISADTEQRFAEAKNQFQETLSLCKELGTDFVEAEAHGSTCSECAKYEGRVFSISGKDKNFPALPKVVFQYGGFHAGCRHRFFPYVIGTPLVYGTGDPVSYSNRPFMDARTDEQKADYEKYLKSSSREKQVWELTSEYYHRKHDDPTSVPGSLYAFLKEHT